MTINDLLGGIGTKVVIYHFWSRLEWIMKKRQARNPRNYSGTGNTTRSMQAIIPGLLEEIGTKFGKRPDLVLHAWPEIIGERLAPMTRALSFHGGVLQVKVNSSTLYSLLSGSEKAKMVEKLRKLFPSIEIKNILFKMG